jgi:hypothetical protein
MPASVPSVPSIKGRAARGIRTPFTLIVFGGPIQYNGVGLLYNDNEITYNYV